MLHLHECVEPAPAKSAAELLHSVGDSAIEESAVEPLCSADDSVAAEPLQFVADASAEASYS
jgi:hypothetical protein